MTSEYHPVIQTEMALIEKGAEAASAAMKAVQAKQSKLARELLRNSRKLQRLASGLIKKRLARQPHDDLDAQIDPLLSSTDSLIKEAQQNI